MAKVRVAAITLIAFSFSMTAWAEEYLSASNAVSPLPVMVSGNYVYASTVPEFDRSAQFYDSVGEASIGDDGSGYQQYVQAPYTVPYTQAPPNTRPTYSYPDTKFYRYWLQVGFRQWWTKGRYVQPLVTTSNAADEGILGRASTDTLYGGENISVGSRGNIDISFGWYSDPQRLAAWEFEVLNVGDAVDDFLTTSTGSPLLALQQYDAPSNTQTTIVIADDEAMGGISTRIRESLLMLGFDRRWNVMQYGNNQSLGLLGLQLRRIDLVAGYRHYRLEDSMWHNILIESSQPIDTLPAGLQLENEDLFYGENEFHGGELGCVVEFGSNRWVLEMFAKMALGNNHQSMSIDGYNELELPEGYVFTQNNQSSINASLAENYSRNRFSIIPRFGLDLCYQLSPRWSLSVGYEFIYWPNVVRGSEQSDFENFMNSYAEGSNLTSIQRSEYSFQTSSYWMQSLNLDVGFRF